MTRYLINSKEVPKNEFFRSLRQDCVKVTDTHVVAGWCGIDVKTFDEKRYRRTLAGLRRGHMVLFLDQGRTYSYQRII